MHVDYAPSCGTVVDLVGKNAQNAMLKFIKM